MELGVACPASDPNLTGALGQAQYASEVLHRRRGSPPEPGPYAV